MHEAMLDGGELARSMTNAMTNNIPEQRTCFAQATGQGATTARTRSGADTDEGVCLLIRIRIQRMCLCLFPISLTGH